MANCVYKNIEEINKNSTLLPNLTIGLNFIDTCGGSNAEVGKLSKIFTNNNSSSISNRYVGIIGGATSVRAIPAAGLASYFQMPFIGSYSTIDELSDKTRFEYFSRLVPPDNFITEAMAHFLKEKKWTYVQLLYSKVTQCENFAKNFLDEVQNSEICVANAQKISSYTLRAFQNVVKTIMKYKKAKVVVVCLTYFEAYHLLQELNKIIGKESFIFISNDIYDIIDKFKHLQQYSIRFRYRIGNYDTVQRCIHSTTPNEVRHVWMKKFWEHVGKYRYVFYNKYIDGTDLYARALNQLIEKYCPKAFYDKSLLNTCITGERVLFHIRNQNFQASSGIQYKFNNRGDPLAEYEITQFIMINNSWISEEIGSWKKDGDILTINTHFNIESVCSKPCLQTQIRVQQELHCCWLCKECRENEILVKNATECLKCPTFFWPVAYFDPFSLKDKETKTRCIEINDEYVEWSDSLSILLIILSGFGVSMNIFVIVMYRVYKEEKIIKASSRFLSGIILFGCSLGYVTVFFFLAKPSIVTCVINRIGFHMTICTIYSPLFVKTLRVYRIFRSGLKGKKHPSFFDHLETRLG
ncbi:DgyrCDS7749 [Dimorphilus gyrociliatus]|uniref:DgyrCDS7749 n=1 Tax=Dimorphilus gyrociliatus TaxID=2664684 RepID=A0A7I8VTR1_9ANNE|nr:DgyrCDS7749 [Dimorphilus gyrociliatus]